MGSTGKRNDNQAGAIFLALKYPRSPVEQAYTAGFGQALGGGVAAGDDRAIMGWSLSKDQMRRRTRIAIIAAVMLLLAIPAWSMHAYGLAVEMDHSRFRYSESIAEARQRGVLAGLPELADSSIVYAGSRLRVREVWVEQVTQVRYRWYLPLTRRVVPLGRYRLVAYLTAADGSSLLSQDAFHLVNVLCATWAGGAANGFGHSAGDGPFFTPIGATIPRRVALHAEPRNCPARPH